MPEVAVNTSFLFGRVIAAFMISLVRNRRGSIQAYAVPAKRIRKKMPPKGKGAFLDRGSFKEASDWPSVSDKPLPPGSGLSGLQTLLKSYFRKFYFRISIYFSALCRCNPARSSASSADRSCKPHPMRVGCVLPREPAVGAVNL